MSTQVYLQNNTPYTFYCGTKVEPSISSGDWTVMNGQAAPNANTFLFWTNRDVGITPDTTFTFNTPLQHKDGAQAEVVDLQLQLVGTTTWSNMAAGFKGEAGSTSSFDSPWYSDIVNGSAYSVSWPQDNGWYSLTMQFVNHSSGGGDNVQYTLNYNAGA